MNDFDMPPATTFGELDIQLRVLRADIHRIAVALPNMATKADIAELSRKFEGYATHEDVRALRMDLELVRRQVESGSVTSRVKVWAEWAQRLSAIAAFLAFVAVAVAYLVHLYDRLPPEPVKGAAK